MPIKLGPHYRERQRRQWRSHVATTLLAALVGGLAIGLAASDRGTDVVRTAAVEAAVSQGLIRRNRPMPGVYYPGCNAARAAGVAPLYAGEPGYRPEMDGDSDGIACEPHRGFQ